MFDELDEEFDDIFARHDLPDDLLEEVRREARKILSRVGDPGKRDGRLDGVYTHVVGCEGSLPHEETRHA